MSVEFDDGVADGLVSALRSADDVLRGQAMERRSAAEDALTEFSGGYHRVLNDACVVEAEDRAILARVCSEAAEAVESAKASAKLERDRQQALADWQLREDQRVRDRAADPVASLAAEDVAAPDPKPSESAVAAPTISAAFQARDRVRESGKAGESAKTSADPARLRRFVSTSRGLNQALLGQHGPLRDAWARFTGSCSWVQFGNVSLVSGFERLVAENQTDALWVEKIAGLFEKAGSGSLSGSALNKAARQVAGDLAKGQDFKDLLKGDLTPAEVSEIWNRLGLDAEAVRELPPELLVKLTDLSGLPAWAQDAASQKFLLYAIENPDVAYELMGFEEVWGKDPKTNQPVLKSTDITRAEFVAQIAAIKKATKDADTKNGDDVPVQLIGLGNHDGWLVAGLVQGNLDIASHLAVNVSGIESSVSDMWNGNNAALQLYRDASDKNKSGTFAVVNWIGYRPPVLADGKVWSMDRADAGGERLASFLNGVHASRESLGAQPKQLTVLAHSYGSTTAVEALKQTDFTVDRLVTYGSAGVKNDTTLAQLKVDRFYATSADEDWTANKGWMSNTKSLDPREIDGVVTFSSNEMRTSDGSKLKAASKHAMFTPEDQDPGYLSKETAALDAATSIIANGKIKPRKKP